MKEMKRLRFGRGQMAPSIGGTKKITLRQYSPKKHKFKEGEVVVGQFDDGLEILIRITADTQIVLMKNLSDDVAREDGFRDRVDAFDGLRRYYSTLDWKTTMIGIIRYEILKHEGVQVVNSFVT